MAIQGILDDFGRASAAMRRLPVPNGDKQVALIDDIVPDALIGPEA
jgi:hypothetical protein